MDSPRGCTVLLGPGWAEVRWRKKLAVSHNDGKLEVEVWYQRHKLEKLIASCPMLKQGCERRVEDNGAGNILFGKEDFDEEMVALEAATTSAGGLFPNIL